MVIRTSTDYYDYIDGAEFDVYVTRGRKITCNGEVVAAYLSKCSHRTIKSRLLKIKRIREVADFDKIFGIEI